MAPTTDVTIHFTEVVGCLTEEAGEGEGEEEEEEAVTLANEVSNVTF